MRGSVLLHRAVIMLMIGGTTAITVATAPDLGLVPDTLPQRFTLGPLMLGFAAMAALISLFVGWNVADHAGRKHLSLMLAFWSLWLALSVVPTGAVPPWRQVAFFVAYVACYYQSFRFYASFPQVLTVESVSKLRARGAPVGGWIGRIDRRAVRTAETILRHRWAQGVIALLMVSSTTWVFRTAEAYSVLSQDFNALSLAEATMTAVVVAAMGCFAWTGFLLADEAGRRKFLWIVLALLYCVGHTAAVAGTFWLDAVTGSRVISVVRMVVDATFLPLTATLLLASYALAVFYTGALDLRPILSKTTLFGALFLALTFVFAIVEEIVEAAVTDRLGLPDGMGAWVGAATITVVMGPIRTQLEVVIKKVGVLLEPEAEAGFSSPSS